ncbi:hypothetical protein KP509_17G014300 [Ceratopteris richardii]|uniref:Uncharacterized protein n=1 Tax=Ceratopteris richardii TaxID=49495 RepID=A0A8T2SS85_CERRI|nr:hypothetical protein KP509_17G014300 [Ceratopteris richardii]
MMDLSKPLFLVLSFSLIFLSIISCWSLSPVVAARNPATSTFPVHEWPSHRKWPSHGNEGLYVRKAPMNKEAHRRDGLNQWHP